MLILSYSIKILSYQKKTPVERLAPKYTRVTYLIKEPNIHTKAPFSLWSTNKVMFC